MKLSKAQIEFVNAERRHYMDIIASKEKQCLYTGIGWDRIQLQCLQMLIRLHNLEVEQENKNKAAPQAVEEAYHPGEGWSEGLS